MSKRPTLEQSASQPPCKKPKPAAKQGKVSALVRVAESGSDKFFALLIKGQVFVFHYFQEHVVVVDYTGLPTLIALREGGSTVELVEGELGSEGISAKMFWRHGPLVAQE